MTKLNLGCGISHKDGYINIDSDSKYKPNIVDDIRNLKYENGSVDEILALHVIEHMSIADVLKCLKMWHDWLTKDGILFIAIPRWTVMRDNLFKSNETTWKDVFFGGESHRWMMDEESLKELLIYSGFEIIGEFDGMSNSTNFEMECGKISLNLKCRVKY